MKTIGSIKEVLSLQSELTMFILAECPWIADQWEAESIGYVFVLDDEDGHKVCTVPESDDDRYREAMKIDLEILGYRVSSKFECKIEC